MSRRFRHTKIIFTIGPATESPSMLRQLILEGVDICRINMAHADHDWTRQIVERVREAGAEVGRKIAVLMDIKGPEIRTGKLEENITLSAGQYVDLTTEEGVSPEQDIPAVSVNYPGLIGDVKEGDTVLLDSGLLRFVVTNRSEGRLRCRVEIGGELGSRRHINLPGVHVSLPCLTKKDLGDIQVGIEAGVDFFALSFVREANDVDVLRRILSERGCPARIVAKIEDQQAIGNLDEIIQASDGLMIARGDLGIECPYEELPIIQERAVQTCIRQLKPAIVATHMLESMISAPVPTRAEVSDIAAAVEQRADAIMLSGETTVGRYPLDCVRVFKRIAERIEMTQEQSGIGNIRLSNPKSKMMRSAVHLAGEIENSAIVVFTRSGYLAQLLSSLRPAQCPIFAFTDRESQLRQMLLMRGVEPFLLEFDEDREQTILNSFERLVQRGWVKGGDWMIVVTNILRRHRAVDAIQLRQIET